MVLEDAANESHEAALRSDVLIRNRQADSMLMK
jgi:hypothetical protein